jgi:hypothetical protein
MPAPRGHVKRTLASQAVPAGELTHDDVEQLTRRRRQHERGAVGEALEVRPRRKNPPSWSRAVSKTPSAKRKPRS